MNILFKKLLLCNIIGCISLLIGGIFLISLNFLFGLFFYVISGFFIYLFNSYFLIQQKIDRQILFLNLLIGIIMATSSFLFQIYYYFNIETSSIESVFLALPFFLGGFQIGHSLIIYRKNYKKQDEIKERIQISSKRLSFLIFTTISVMGIGFFIFLITEDFILGVICLMIGIVCIIPLNILVHRYCIKISIQMNRKEFNKKFIIIGQISALIIIFLTFFLYYGNFNVPFKPLLVLGLSIFEIFLILDYIRKDL